MKSVEIVIQDALKRGSKGSLSEAYVQRETQILKLDHKKSDIEYGYHLRFNELQRQIDELLQDDSLFEYDHAENEEQKTGAKPRKNRRNMIYGKIDGLKAKQNAIRLEQNKKTAPLYEEIQRLNMEKERLSSVTRGISG